MTFYVKTHTATFYVVLMFTCLNEGIKNKNNTIHMYFFNGKLYKMASLDIKAFNPRLTGVSAERH